MNGRIGSMSRSALVLAVAAVLLVATAATAAPGDLDSSFSGDGLRTIDLGGPSDYAEAVLVQADGRIVLGGYSAVPAAKGDFSLARLRSGGLLDTSFSGDGKTIFDFRGVGGWDEVFDLAQQDNGRIVAAGYAENADGSTSGFAVARFLANGNLDTTFSGDGKRIVTFPGFPEAFGYAVVLQPDGKIVVGGEVGDDGTDWDFAVARLNPNGVLDPTFGGGDGRVTTSLAPHYDGIWDMVLQPDGKLVAGGWSRDDTNTQYRFAFARYKTGGALDPTFSGDGKLVVDMDPTVSDYVEGIEVRADGKIVADGYVSSSPLGVGLVRIKPGGALDPTFDGDGKLLSTPVPEGLGVRDLDLAAGNKLIVTGYWNVNPRQFFVARYNPGGALDSTFGGGDGIVFTAFPGSTNALPYRSAIQPNGRIVVAGYSGQTDPDFAVARYLP